MNVETLEVECHNPLRRHRFGDFRSAKLRAFRGPHERACRLGNSRDSRGVNSASPFATPKTYLFNPLQKKHFKRIGKIWNILKHVFCDTQPPHQIFNLLSELNTNIMRLKTTLRTHLLWHGLVHCFQNSGLSSKTSILLFV